MIFIEIVGINYTVREVFRESNPTTPMAKCEIASKYAAVGGGTSLARTREIPDQCGGSYETPDHRSRTDGRFGELRTNRDISARHRCHGCQERRQQRFWTAGGSEVGPACRQTARWRELRGSQIADYVVESHDGRQRASSDGGGKASGARTRCHAGGANPTTSRRGDTSAACRRDVFDGEQAANFGGSKAENCGPRSRRIELRRSGRRTGAGCGERRGSAAPTSATGSRVS